MGALVLTNVAIGAASVVVQRAIRGESIWDGAAIGAAGGLISFSGRLIAAETAGGVAGRYVAAVGHSMIINSSRADEPFSSLYLPIGPIWLTLRPGELTTVSATVDVVTSVALVWALAEPEVDIDWRQSFARGALVLDSADPFRNGEIIAATFGGGFVAYRGLRSEALFRHELVHVVEAAFVDATVGQGLEQLVLGALGTSTPSHLHIGMATTGILMAGHRWFPELLEIEADYLAPYRD